MDEINSLIKRALNFVHIVQRCCDQQRHTLEHHFKSELSNHAKELSQKEDCKEEEEKNPVPEIVEKPKDESSDSDTEALELADKLLRKARYIRQKYKVKNLDLEVVKEPSECSVSFVGCDNNNEHDPFIEKCLSECKVRQSHSAPLMNRGVAKSSRVEPCSKDSRFAKTSRSPSESNIPVRAVKKSIVARENDSMDESKEVAIVSEEMYKTIRNLKVDDISNKNAKETITKAKKYPVPSNSTKREIKKPSSITENIKGCNRKLKTKLANVKSAYASTCVQKRQTSIRQVLRKSNEPTFENGTSKTNFLPYFWYPFIVSENKLRLITHITCRNQEEFRRILILCYKIQEAMFWIDFFSLIGGDAIPPLENLDQRDQKVTLIISYMQGLFHENLQRLPVIVQSNCVKVISVCEDSSSVPKKL